MKKALFWAMLFAFWLTAMPFSPALWAMDRAVVESEPLRNPKIDSMRHKSKEIQNAAQDLESSEQEMHAQASALFEEILPQGYAVHIGTINLRGWEKPEYEKNPTYDVDSLMRGMKSGIFREKPLKRGFRASPVPPPELLEAHTHAERMRALTGYSDELDNNVLGIYVYRTDSHSPIGIFFNNQMPLLQGWLGDQLAAATHVHEAKHAGDHANSNLSPRRVRAGEVSAFQAQYIYLLTMDPTGEKLSWARATFGKFAKGPWKAPEFVSEYLEHLAMIRRYGDLGNFEGLVVALGYQENPGHAHAEHMHGHDSLAQEPYHLKAAN